MPATVTWDHMLSSRCAVRCVATRVGPDRQCCLGSPRPEWRQMVASNPDTSLEQTKGRADLGVQLWIQSRLCASETRCDALCVYVVIEQPGQAWQSAAVRRFSRRQETDPVRCSIRSEFQLCSDAGGFDTLSVWRLLTNCCRLKARSL